jgi:hypothetical protein
MTYGALPADLVNPGSYAVAIGIGDEHANALTEFCCYWSYAKDADFSNGARERALAWYSKFQSSIGIAERVETDAVAPDAAQHDI